MCVCVCVTKKPTFRNGNGSSISTLRNLMLVVDEVMSVCSAIFLLNFLTPDFFDKLKSSVGTSSIFPISFSIFILIFAEFRILHIVEVDSWMFLGKIFFP